MQRILQHLQENTESETEHYISYDQDDFIDCGFFESHNQDHDNNNSKCTLIVNTILSWPARLNALQLAPTIIFFMVFAPFLTKNGRCTALDQWLTSGFTAILAALSAFFPITDSFRMANGRLCYGVATVHGIRTFGGHQPHELSDYRLRWGDLFRVLLSLIAFLAFALLNRDVVSCYRVVLSREFMDLGRMVVWFVVNLLIVFFPSERRGIGNTF
ncbi:Protein of unknown function (DUF679 [Striga hermonthica]|uniref:Uncharacterized protein n=1 Tax=Striga hermonthica TaxID=68872 RepID=A0A9N7NDX4_STRHE|nr:Protein of unknown function (DUF679 [Striga hermonthica]